MGRFYTKKEDIKKPEMSNNDILNFFNTRANKIDQLDSLRAVMYQDGNPELVVHRDIAEKEILLSKLKINKKIRVLDVGCGVGRWLDSLNDNFKYYHGIDIDNHKNLIVGTICEIAENTYSKKFSKQNSVKKIEIMHYTNENSVATVIGDINMLNENSIDCFILTQTLNFIYDVKAAIEGLHYVLSPNGTALVTVAGICQISRYDMNRWGDYWRLNHRDKGKKIMKYLILDKLAKELYRFLFNRRQREFYLLHDKYAKSERFVLHQDINFLSFKIDVPDLLSFVWQFHELYVEEIYKFESLKAQPVIIDCGANIGLSCMYFKSIFPKALIKAFEADPQIAMLLKNNLQRNNFSDIEVINKAVWIHNDGVKFIQDGADGGFLNAIGNSIEIPSLSLKNYLKNFVIIDLLKIDIEGAEYEVLKDCNEELSRVENIFIEYHSFSNTEQYLSEILDILEVNGFRYYIESLSKRNNPFINKASSLKMDLQLNIFGYKI
ncbi:hypothetical protein FQR65_LT18160 [Abscondita terminalis]|nr:hypothetical protein FQR65_LT18160 [Abscondita terminalis]